MTQALALLIWTCFGAYLAVGVLVAIGLLGGLIGRLDALAAKAPLRVRLIWLPGLMLLWPILLWKTIFKQRP